ncbi:MAG TPA: DUF3857 domain-containing protein [Candidatus Bathyarchaeia archaeon]|nr:DUF3857 domain-containing protein [Candidatus Bathyarchaeia archaeon]
MKTFSARLFAAVFAAYALSAYAVALSATADTLYLRDGEQQLGRLREITEDSVVFELRGGELKTFPKEKVNQIQLQRARLFDEIEAADQITDPDLTVCLESQPAEADFPADGTATLLERRTIDLCTPGVVKDTNRVITKILRQRGEDAGSHLVPYFEDTDQPQIDFALTVTPEGRVLHLSDAAVKNESVYASLPDYRRLARYRFAAKEPAPWCILDVQYTIVRTRETSLEPFYTYEVFRYEAPLLRKEVVVLIPAAREAELARNVHAVESAPIEEAREVKDGIVRFTYTLSAPQPGILREPLMPPVTSFASTVTLAEAKTWDDIVRDYGRALDGVAPLSEAVKAKAVELAAQGGPQAIHDFIARSIRTLPVPHKNYRVVPHSPDETVRRGMANELDKNFLYCKMLEAAGVPAVFALVRSRNAGPLCQEAASIRAFDRSAVYLGGEKTFTNAASDLIPYGTLPAGIQNSPALVIAPARADSAQPATVANTQISSLDQEKIATTFDSTLEPDGTLELKVAYTGEGNTGAWMRGMKSLDQQQLRNQLQQIASSLHHAAVLDNFTCTDFTDLKVTPAITLEITIPGFAVKAGDLLLLNIPGVTYDAGDVGRPTREFDLFWSQIVSETTSGVIRLPDGLKPYAIPDSVKFDSGPASYEATLTPNGQTIEFTDAYQLKVQSAPRDAYADYKKCHEARANLTRQRIILTTEPGSAQ